MRVKAWSFWKLFCHHWKGAYQRWERIQRTEELKDGESPDPDDTMRAVPEAKFSLDFLITKPSTFPIKV